MSKQPHQPQQVNLLDASLLRKRELLTRNMLLGVMGVGVLIVTTHAILEQQRLSQELLKLNASASVANEVQPDANATPPTEGILAKVQEQIKRSESLRTALANNGDLPDHAGPIVKAIIGAMPDKVWLTELKVLGDKSLLITGGALQQSALTEFSQQLEAHPLLAGTPITIVQLRAHHGWQSNLGDISNASQDGDPPKAGQPHALSQPTHFAFTIASLLPTSDAEVALQ